MGADKKMKKFTIIMVIVASVMVLAVIGMFLPKKEKSKQLERDVSGSSSAYQLSEKESSREESSKQESSRQESSRKESSRQESSRKESSVQSSSQQLKSYTFTLNTSTKVYHTRSCSAASKIKDENKSVITIQAYSQKEANLQVEQMGYTHCGLC